MKTAVVFEKETKDLVNLLKAFNEKQLNPTFVEIGQIGLFVENNASHIVVGENGFDFDAVFLQARNGFTVFVEPFLSELVDRGIYCQLKPNAFYIISNRPYAYSVLNHKGIKICKTQILGEPESIESVLKNIAFPLHLKIFSENKKIQGFIVDSEKGLKSILKNTSLEIDAFTIQEFIDGDLSQSLVIGDDVFTVKRKWVEKELSHSIKAISSKLHEQEQETAIKATRVVGADIATVKMINGTVINVRSLINFELYQKTLGVNTFSKIAQFFKEKFTGE